MYVHFFVLLPCYKPLLYFCSIFLCCVPLWCLGVMLIWYVCSFCLFVIPFCYDDERLLYVWLFDIVRCYVFVMFICVVYVLCLLVKRSCSFNVLYMLVIIICHISLSCLFGTCKCYFSLLHLFVIFPCYVGSFYVCWFSSFLCLVVIFFVVYVIVSFIWDMCLLCFFVMCIA